jgi:hypothetical protein
MWDHRTESAPPSGTTREVGGHRWSTGPEHEETPMSKRGRKRRARKGNGANHGNRPNA